MVFGKLDDHVQKNEIGLSLTHSQKSTITQIINLYTIHSIVLYVHYISKQKLTQNGLKVKPGIIKLLEEIIEKTFFDIGISNGFFGYDTKSSSSKNRMKRQCVEWEKIFVNCVSDKRLMSKIHKEPLQLNSKKTNNLILKMSKGPEQTFPKGCIQMARRFTRRCLTSLTIRKVQIKASDIPSLIP